MKDEKNDNLVDLKKEKNNRIHIIHDKKLKEVQNAFKKAFPLHKNKKNNKKK